MAHSPALGCCGLISTNVYVLCTKSISEKNKSKYVIHHVLNENNSVIGVNPMLANHIVKSLLLNNKIDEFQNIINLKSEVTIDESRFDFSFMNENGKKVYLEVKNVPLADVEKKIAFFPDGYRKNKLATISERALKHTNHLTEIHKENPDIICALLFLIQRNDVEYFQPSSLDPIYQSSVYNAFDNGVKILPICVTWNNNECYFLKKINLLR